MNAIVPQPDVLYPHLTSSGVQRSVSATETRNTELESTCHQENIERPLLINSVLPDNL